MKLTILTALLAMVIMSGAVLAQGFPSPISGMVSTNGYNGGYDVTVTNTNTNDFLVVVTNAKGQYIIHSWSNFFKEPASQDVFHIEVEGEYKNVVYTGGPIEADFNLNVVCPKQEPIVCKTCETPTCPAPIACPECPNPTTCTECPTCPSPPTCPTNPTCPTCETCEECPEPTPQDATNSILAAIIAAAAAGAAVTVTFTKKGPKHHHRGIRTKHSIYTRHRDPEIRHPMGELTPIYRRNTKGKYVYMGGN